MKIALDTHPDGGYWISDDRVNAFISSRARGIGEVGFHGLQPVSRNSRVLVSGTGVLTASIRSGKELPFLCSEVEWAPGSVETFTRKGKSEFRLRVGACGRSLVLLISGPPGEDAEAVVRFHVRSLFAEVHGERIWTTPAVRNGRLEFECRDRIHLKDWLKREGPYGFDFLIPEPWRRIVFRKCSRSGLASKDDLRPEFRDADIILYDARTRFRIGGDEFTAVQDQDGCSFSARLSRQNNWRREIRLECSEEPSGFEPGPPPLTQGDAEAPPEVDIPGRAHTRRFFAAVPGIVRSCTLRETGMTRATPGSYYWIWAWDTMVTALEMLRWGDAEGAARIVRFINTHRDKGGAIPARWTRTFMPLDTPPAGTFEFLLLLLAFQSAGEGTGEPELHDIYPFAVERLREAARSVQDQGLEENIGFYPDLPVRFGRSESSTVAMESGTLYAFCRLLECVALQQGDRGTAGLASETARRVQSAFETMFWDGNEGFFIDSVDLRTKERNRAYPLFTMMFMQTPLALPLVRAHLGAIAQFARKHFLTPHGTHLLPAGDSRTVGEDALSSWYPHWDIYLLKVLRRGGDREGILSWLDSVESVLGRLGYAPEFITHDALAVGGEEAWRRHGSVSNLNCSTGWYRAILEGVFGIEFDTGGMSVIPLNLGIPSMSLLRLAHRGSQWDVDVLDRGGETAELRIDGTPFSGSLKVPARYHDGKGHKLEVIYSGREPVPCFTEIVNAEVISTEGDSNEARVTIRDLGTVDLAFPAKTPVELRVDGAVVPFQRAGGTGYVQIPPSGVHTLVLREVL